MTERNPLAGNPLRSFEEVAAAVRDCYEPLRPHVSAGGARVRLGSSVATFADAASEMEGFARPLWGLAPLAAGGGDFAHWHRLRSGLVAGTDPGHPEYWGAVGDRDQRIVEMAAIGAGLVLAPDHLWDPLEADERRRVAMWLRQVDHVEPVDNNWWWFRVLTDLGLARVGEDYDERAHTAALARIEQFAHAEGESDGWYTDGESGRADWYIAFAFHTYGLLYARSGLGDPSRAQVFRERAAAFAPQHRRWFAPDGTALAFGRSMGYRFAQAAFWGSLALADVEALPWGEVRGICLRNLRSWSTRPIADGEGVLTTGYGYRTDLLAEAYSSPGSAYWAAKGFLALGAGPGHPFWTTEEEPLEPPTGSGCQRPPGLVLTADEDQVLAVSAGNQPTGGLLEGNAKYARFAYSTRFGFSADDAGGVRNPTSESTLVVIDALGNRRVRGGTTDVHLEDDCVISRWEPWPGVTIDTALWPSAPWHLRAHRISTGQPLRLEEWGFALGFERHLDEAEFAERCQRGSALVASSLGCSGLLDGDGSRPAAARTARPNANLLWPRTVVPVLTDEVGAGLHERITLVFGSGPGGVTAFRSPPEVPQRVLELLRARMPGAVAAPSSPSAARLEDGIRSVAVRGRRLVRKGRGLLDRGP